MSILARDVEARWRQMADHETYVPLRDGKRRRSRWVIDTLHDRLPPEHVLLARQLFALQALVEGVKPVSDARVDCMGNAVEIALTGRLDAQRAIAGFEGSVFRTLARGGVLCLRSICAGDTLADTIRSCGYAAGSDRRTCELVQLTMLQASDYDELCKADQRAWGDRSPAQQCA